MFGEAVRMTGKPIETEHDAAVLDTPVRIDELGADATDPFLLGEDQHLLKPVLAQNLDIVVDETDHIAAARAHRGVVQAEKLKGTGCGRTRIEGSVLSLSSSSMVLLSAEPLSTIRIS